MDMLIGDVKRAPRWMQRSGFEWLGRCIQEPRRLMPRYGRNARALAMKLPVAIAASLLQRPHRGTSAQARSSDSGMVHLHVQGNLEASTAAAIDRTVDGCIEGGQLLVVHFSELSYASPEGLGALLDARQRLLAMGLSLTLAGVPARMKLLFSAWCLEPLFDEFRLERERFALGKRRVRRPAFAALLTKQPAVAMKGKG